MADGFVRLIVGFLLFGLVSVLIINGISEMRDNYGVSNERMNEVTMGALDVDDYKEELLESNTDAENFREIREVAKGFKNLMV